MFLCELLVLYKNKRKIRFHVPHKRMQRVLTVNAAVICGAVDCAIRQQLQIAILEEHLYGAGGASYVAQVGGALRARLGRGGRGAGRERERRQEQPQRARARAHGAPRPWQPPGRRHCTTPPLIPRSTPHDFHHPVSSKSFLLYL